MSGTGRKVNRKKWEDGCTDRINRLRDTYWENTPEIDTERARIYTRVYKETEGEETVIRRAKALQAYVSEKTIVIGDDELIVGTEGKKNRSATVCPDICFRSEKPHYSPMCRSSSLSVPLRAASPPERCSPVFRPAFLRFSPSPPEQAARSPVFFLFRCLSAGRVPLSLLPQLSERKYPRGRQVPDRRHRAYRAAKRRCINKSVSSYSFPHCKS